MSRDDDYDDDLEEEADQVDEEEESEDPESIDDIDEPSPNADRVSKQVESADDHAYFLSPQKALSLVKSGFKPAGPYGRGDRFVVHHRKTGQKFSFALPLDSSGKPDPSWLEKLKERYYEIFPNDKHPEGISGPVRGFAGIRTLDQAVDPLPHGDDMSDDSDLKVTTDPETGKPMTVKAAETVSRRGITDDGLWLTSKDPTKPLLKNMIERTSWLQNAVYDLGFDVLFALVRATGKAASDQSDWMDAFHTKDGFQKMYRKHLSALLELNENAKQFNEMREQLLYEVYSKEGLVLKLDQTTYQAQKLKAALDMAVVCMCPEDRARYTSAQLVNIVGVGNQSPQDSLNESIQNASRANNQNQEQQQKQENPYIKIEPDMSQYRPPLSRIPARMTQEEENKMRGGV